MKLLKERVKNETVFVLSTKSTPLVPKKMAFSLNIYFDCLFLFEGDVLLSKLCILDVLLITCFSLLISKIFRRYCNLY
jgi:hypothetical protein